jgi:hypothetical protein
MTPAREKAEHLHALALMGITTPNQTWLASIDFDALKAKWAAEDAEQNQLECAEYEQWLDEQEQGQ